MKNIILKAENIKKTYKMGDLNVNVLKGISLEIEKGSLSMILGPSGSGKSTLLNMLGALDKPNSGKIFMKKENITELDDYSLALFRRYYLGFVFQSFNLIPTLNVLENVLISTIPDNKDNSLKEKAIEIIKRVGLSHRLNHKPNQLSGGERQRVSIARSLINNPEIIFADEPTGNLDSKTGKQIIDLINQLREEEHKTFVMVTHDEALTKYADKIFKMKDGLLTN